MIGISGQIRFTTPDKAKMTVEIPHRYPVMMPRQEAEKLSDLLLRIEEFK